MDVNAIEKFYCNNKCENIFIKCRAGGTNIDKQTKLKLKNPVTHVLN